MSLEWDAKAIRFGKESSNETARAQIDIDDRLCALREKLEQKHILNKEKAELELTLRLKKHSDEYRHSVETHSKRLAAFLEDVKDRMKSATDYNAVIPSTRIDWDSSIDTWRCDLKEAKAVLVDACKGSLAEFKQKLASLPTDVVESSTALRITEVNEMIVGNEKLYADTEVYLKSTFETLLQNWIRNYCYDEELKTFREQERLEALQGECEEEEVPEFKHLTYQELLLMVYGLESIIKAPLPTFNMIPNFFMYLNHMDVCKEYIRLYEVEALKLLKNCLEAEEPDIPSYAWLSFIYRLEALISYGEKMIEKSAKIWNELLDKLVLAEEIGSKAVHSCRISVFKKIPGFELKINELLDKLREERTAVALKIDYEQICTHLTAIENHLLSMRQGEDTIIQQFADVCTLALNVFSADSVVLSPFVFEAPTLPPSLSSEEQLGESEKLSSEEKINAMMLQHRVLREIAFYSESALNWADGLRETFLLLDTNLTFFVKNLLRRWMFQKKGESEFWCRFHIERIAQRKKKIQMNISDIRLSELVQHESAVRQITKAVKSKFADLTNSVKHLKANLRSMDLAFMEYCEQSLATEGKTRDKLRARIQTLKINRLFGKHLMNKNNLIIRLSSEINRVCQWLHSSITSFLSSVKMFGEGGNYSAEEVIFLTKTIEKLHRNVTSENIRVRRFIDKVRSTANDQIKKKMERFTKKTYLQFNLQESLQSEIDAFLSSIRRALRVEALNAKCLIEVMDKKLIGVKDKGSISKWKKVLRGLSLYSQYFALPPKYHLEIDKILKKYSFQVKIDSLRTSDPVKKIIRPKSKHSNKKTFSKMVLSFKNKSIMEVKPEPPALSSKNNFLLNTRQVIHSSSELSDTINLELAERFSHKLVPLLEKQFRMKLLSYTIQCELSWLQMVYGFISLIIRAHHQFEQFLRSEIKTFHNQWLALLHIHMVDYENKMQNLCGSEIKGDLSKCLKPWHGYPKNEHLLDELIHEARKAAIDIVEEAKLASETLRDNLKSLSENRKPEMDQMTHDLTGLHHKIYSDPRLEDFLQELIKYTSKYARRPAEFDTTRLKTFINETFKEKQPWGRKTLGDNLHLTYFSLKDDICDYPSKIRVLRSALREATEDNVIAQDDDNKVNQLDWFHSQMANDTKQFESQLIRNLMKCRQNFTKEMQRMGQIHSDWATSVHQVKDLYNIKPILEQPQKKLDDYCGLLKP